MNHPQISIIGAPKAGTSAVHFWLSGLDGVNAADPKETFFFIDHDCPMKNSACNQDDNDLQDYLKFYKDIHSGITLDSTAHYLYQDSAIEQFSRADTRVCVMLRDPVKRITSYFLYLTLTQSAVRKPISFDDYVDTLLSPNKDLSAENFYHSRDHYALNNALDHGCYANHLDRWVSSIDNNKLLIVVFEELIRSTPQQLSRIGEFFGLTLAEQDVGSLKKENETVNVRYPGLNRLVRAAGRLVPGEHIKKTLRDVYLNLQRTEVPDLYGLYPESIEALWDFYEPHNERLKEEYGIDVSLWRRRRCETENSVESTASHN